MNFLDIRAGENIEVGTQLGYRFWRYVFLDHYGKACLFSYIANRQWFPGRIFDARAPDGGPANVDVGEQGIHAFKSMDDLSNNFPGYPIGLVSRAEISGCHGLIVGTVELWGVMWQHKYGYRAQFARPLSFDSSYGRHSVDALTDLRARFFQ